MAEKDKKSADDPEAPEAGSKVTGPPSLKMLVIILVAAMSLVGVSVVSTVVVMHTIAGSDAEPADEVDVATDATAGDSKAKKDKKSKKKDKDKGKDKDKEATPEVVTYLPLDPPFVVNFEQGSGARFLQTSMEVMAKNPLIIEDVKKHMPAIRNSLVFLLSSQNYQTLSTNEGKEKIRAQALAAVQKILEDHTGKPGIEAIYFTNFVMQ